MAKIQKCCGEYILVKTSKAKIGIICDTDIPITNVKTLAVKELFDIKIPLR